MPACYIAGVPFRQSSIALGGMRREREVEREEGERRGHGERGGGHCPTFGASITFWLSGKAGVCWLLLVHGYGEDPPLLLLLKAAPYGWGERMEPCLVRKQKTSQSAHVCGRGYR